MGLQQHSRTLRDHLADEGLLVAPGVYDGLSARIAQQTGFRAVYVSGGAIARSFGVPDLGLLSMTEMRERVAAIADVVDVPIIADADTGYGNALNVRRTVREFIRAGVAAIHIEDQVTPKKCGHYAGKELISTGEMCGKIRAALDARTRSDLVVIARTDAVAVEGIDAAIERAKAYHAEGADMLFVEAPESVEHIRAIARALEGIPLLINMFAGGRTPLLPAHDIEQLGYRIMIVPSDLQRAAIHAMQQAAQTLMRDGSTAAMREAMSSFEEREALVGLHAYREAEERYGHDGRTTLEVDKR